MKLIINKIEQNNHSLVIFLFFLTFVIVFGDINRTAYFADDFFYMNNYLSGEKIQNISDIIQSQIDHYFLWGGRSVVHFILQFLLLIGKPFSSILCSCIYTSMIYMICKLTNGFNKIRFEQVCFVAGLMYYFNPIWHETVTWMTGNANYVWGIFFGILVLFLLYYFDLHKISLTGTIVFSLLSFIAGWTNENIGITIALIIITYSHFTNTLNQKWKISGIILCLLGFCVMIIAPGNFVRSSLINETTTLISSILLRIYGVNSALFNSLFIPFIMSTLLLLFLYKNNKSLKNSSMLFYCGALFSIFIMIAPPTYPERATFGSMMFFVISICFSIQKLLKKETNIFMFISIMLYFGFLMNTLPSLLLTVLGLR